MSNVVTAWQIKPENGSLLEPVVLKPAPLSLDQGTRLLPGGGYTTFRTFGRFRVLRLEEHFLRLEETARLAGKLVQLDREKISLGLHQALAAYPANEMRVRVTLDLERAPGTIYILVDELHTPGDEDYRQGVGVVTRQMQRQNPKAKLTSFISTASAVREKLPPGINEAVMIGEDGRALEGLSSNFFAVTSGVIWTAEQGVLSGITRSLVLEVIAEEGIPLRLEGVPAADLGRLDEAFITSASRAVLPVTIIDGQAVGDGLPGPVTRRLMEGYHNRLERELDSI